MADDRIREEIITEFFLSTCQSRRRANREDVTALLFCADLSMQSVLIPTAHATRDSWVVSGDIIPLITGSVAEFYIEPVLSCFGDVDIMLHTSTQLAIPAGCTPPTQLPGEFSSRVDLYEIVDSQFPGYVYLYSSYLLTECDSDGKYNAMQCERDISLCSDIVGDRLFPRHGPALQSETSIPSVGLAPSIFGLQLAAPVMSRDEVYCMRCLIWPPQAADWPTRHRNYGWPDSATVDCVISNGCDVVSMAHPLCRHDEWMRICQWRLSFSRAEIVLLNSWMPVQQIVYHVLRHFMKNEILTESVNNSVAGTVSNYHIKTLMLWACELKSSSWWTDGLNLVEICVKLLHALTVWLTDACCQHYFINNCNLFDRFENSRYTKETVNRLMPITKASFCKWCIDSYLHACAQLCPSFASNLLWSPFFRRPREQLHPVIFLQNVVSEIVKWKMDMSPKLNYTYFTAAQCGIMMYVSDNSLTLQSCLCLMNKLAKFDEILHFYFTAIVFLHVAHKTIQTSLSDEMLDVLATTCLQSNDVRHCLNARHRSVLSLNQAAMLMKVVANGSHSTVQLIEIELSKAYLHRALRLIDSDNDSIYSLANVYLAVLYYTTGQHQMAIDHCALVTRLQDHSQCSSHAIQGELLLRIDEQINSVLGLAVFYQYIQAAASTEKHNRHVSVFTTKMLAHYLHVKFLSVTKCHQLSQTSLTHEVQQYRSCLCISPEAFLTDVMLFCLTDYSRYMYPSIDRLKTADRRRTKLLICEHLDTSKLIKLLEQSAVEFLTKCRQLEVRDFGSLGHFVTTDFSALYAYKCGQDQRCLQLSAYNVNTLTVGKSHGVAIPLCRELLQLMDDDIVSVIGLVVLANQPCKSDRRCKVGISQLTLLLYLLSQCQIKLRHSITSMARTLDHVHKARLASEQISQVITSHFGEDSARFTVGHVLLKFVEQKILRYAVSNIN